jgi:hypothetical protein
VEVHHALMHFYQTSRLRWPGVMMNGLTLLVFALLSAVAFAIIREDCASYGFNVAVLSCETCDHMNKILDHTATYENCKSCCIEKVEEVYEQAVLEVDKRYIAYMREISAVIENKQKLKLKVRYRTATPTLNMYKEKGDSVPAESIPVGSWDKATFEEYLSTHLKGNVEAKKGSKAGKS